MCVVTDNIKFCTCISGSYEELPHYWLLYRYDKKKKLLCIGMPSMPLDFLQPNHQVNKQTLLKRLNESDAFDTEIKFKPKDQLEIVLNNLSEIEIERMTFCFKYKNGKWMEEEFDVFELMNKYDELAFGNFEQIDEKSKK